MIHNAHKMIQWLNDWFVRPSEVETLQMEIEYWKLQRDEALAQQEALKESQIQNRESELYESYSETIKQQAIQSYDTF